MDNGFFDFGGYRFNLIQFKTCVVFYIKFPTWLCRTYDWILKSKIYLIVPLAGLTIANYVKDYKLDRIEKENKSLTSSINVLITNQISSAGIVEQTDLVFWVKELVDDEYKIIYLSPGYQRFISKSMNRYQLLGRTGEYLDVEFGKIYQNNDRLASKLSEPRIFKEPYRSYGVGPKLMGNFLKGKVISRNDRDLVFGIFIENADKLEK